MTEIFQDIRKNYIFCKPCEELIPFVEFFSVSLLPQPGIDTDNDSSTVKMFRSWTPTFYINLGPAYIIDLKGTPRRIAAGEDILILRNQEVTRYISPADNIFTVKFYPGGLEAILGINQVSFMDKVTDLRTILPLVLLEALKAPVTFEERVEIMQNYLRNALAKRNRDYHLHIIRNAILEYQNGGMQLSTAELAKDLFITSKTMNRYFSKVIGVAPKSYLTILRARTALTEYVKHKQYFAYGNFGYYDQSHFRKEVILFTGQKLSEQSR